MQVKKFEAPTLQEALDNVKRELGPEAVILQTKKYKRGFGLLSKASVEITAAVSDRSLQKKKVVEHTFTEPNKNDFRGLPADKQVDAYDKYMEKHLAKVMSQTADRVELKKAEDNPVKKITSTRYIDIPDENQTRKSNKQSALPKMVEVAKSTVEEEVRQLKRILNEMKGAQDEQLHGSGAQALIASANTFTPVLQDAFEQLIVSGIEKRFALSLIKKIGFELGPTNANKQEQVLDQLASELITSVEVVSVLGDLRPREGSDGAPRVIAMVGPTGVGKTTTVAKVASEAILKNHLKVGLINLDTYKLGAFDQLATYAKILNVPFRSAASADDLKAAIKDFQNLDLVIIDSTGRSHRDSASLSEMHQLIRAVDNIQTYLVLSATTRDLELYDVANRFAVFRPSGLVISKLDEATVYGAIYNVCQKSKLPLAYFTTGQRVPEDIEEASQERVVSLLMDL